MRTSPEGTAPPAGIEAARQATPTLPTAEDRETLRQYLAPNTFDYRKANQSLRTGEGEQRHRELASRVDAMARAAKPLAEPVTVYRGVAASFFSGDQNQHVRSLLNAKPGEEIQLDGLTSTSHDPARALEFTREGVAVWNSAMLEIQASHGMDVEKAMGDDYTPESEKEFIIPSKARFRVVGQKTIQYRDLTGKVVRAKTVQLEQLPD